MRLPCALCILLKDSKVAELGNNDQLIKSPFNNLIGYKMLIVKIEQMNACVSKKYFTLVGKEFNNRKNRIASLHII